MENDFYICTRVRACKWRGRHVELRGVPDGRERGRINNVCPQCGNREFFVHHVCSAEECSNISTHFEAEKFGYQLVRTFKEFCEFHAAQLETSPGYRFVLRKHNH